MEVASVARILAEFGHFYWQGGNVRKKDEFRELESDWKKALIEFLRGVAFERKGRSPQYSPAAVASVEAYSGAIPADDLEKFVWGNFSSDEWQLEPAKYLQPIDIWTRRGAQCLAQSMGSKPKLNSDQDCAEFLVKASRSARVSPALVNAGLWIFGAEFTRSEKEFERALTSHDDLGQFVERQRELHTARRDFLDELLSKFWRQGSTADDSGLYSYGEGIDP